MFCCGSPSLLMNQIQIADSRHFISIEFKERRLSSQFVSCRNSIIARAGNITQYSSSVIDVLKRIRDSGKMGNKVAMVNVADEYGIESANVSRKLFPAAGFDLVYDKSYPLGTQDYAPVVKAAKAAKAATDAFIAFSYPPDTFGLTDQAKIEDLNVKAYYNGVGFAFAGYAGKNGAAIENVIGFGGMPDNEKIRTFLEAVQRLRRGSFRLQRLPIFLRQWTSDETGV